MNKQGGNRMKKIFLVALLGFFGVAQGYQLTGIEGYDENGKTRVVIATNDVPQYRAFVILNPPRLIIDLLNAEDSLLKEKIKNRSNAILGISSQQRLKEPVKITRVTIALKQVYPYQLLSDKNSCLIEMDTGISEKKEVKKEVKEEPVPVPEMGILPPLGKIEEAIKPKEEKIEEEKEEELFSMRFYETDLLDVLRALSKKIKKDIVSGPDVSGVITIELNNVKWDQALNMILKPNNFNWVEEDGIIRVDTKENLLKTAVSTEVVPINYDKAEDMSKNIEPLLDPDAGGKIVIDKRTNSLIITTTSKNLEEIKGVIKNLDLPTPQIMIESKMVTIDSNETQNLGIRWGFTHPSSAQDTTEGLVNLQPGLSSTNFSIGRLSENTNLFLQLQNLITKEKAELISAPKIATSDNQKAKIKVGGEAPYAETTPSAEGSAVGVSVKYIDMTTELEITPKVNPDKTVLLELKISTKGGNPENTIEVAGVGEHTAPTKSEQEIETKIIVQDGETIVIGGMIAKDEQVIEYSVPFFSDLPFIGRAFRHKSTRASSTGIPMKRELLVFLTPHILNQ
ncbi:MAG: secretin N-terminal domain-containing protein [bacterium]